MLSKPLILRLIISPVPVLTHHNTNIGMKVNFRAIRLFYKNERREEAYPPLLVTSNADGKEEKLNIV